MQDPSPPLHRSEQWARARPACPTSAAILRMPRWRSPVGQPRVLVPVAAGSSPVRHPSVRSRPGSSAEHGILRAAMSRPGHPARRKSVAVAGLAGYLCAARPMTRTSWRQPAAAGARPASASPAIYLPETATSAPRDRRGTDATGAAHRARRTRPARPRPHRGPPRLPRRQSPLPLRPRHPQPSRRRSPRPSRPGTEADAAVTTPTPAPAPTPAPTPAPAPLPTAAPTSAPTLSATPTPTRPQPTPTPTPSATPASSPTRHLHLYAEYAAEEAEAEADAARWGWR